MKAFILPETSYGTCNKFGQQLIYSFLSAHLYRSRNISHLHYHRGGRIKVGVFCTACGREETIIHRFWECPHSVCFWRKHRSEIGISVAIQTCNNESQSKLTSWLLGWFVDAPENERSMVQAVWHSSTRS